MEFQLSFCTVHQIEDALFEIFVKEGAVVDAACAKEELDFWTEHRNEPFGILLNCNASFSYDFAGASQIGKSPFQRKIAVLTYNNFQYRSNSLAIEISKVEMPEKVARIFHDRDEAIEWLKKEE